MVAWEPLAEDVNLSLGYATWFPWQLLVESLLFMQGWVWEH